jgi:hypothetical protein
VLSDKEGAQGVPRVSLRVRAKVSQGWSVVGFDKSSID